MGEGGGGGSTTINNTNTATGGAGGQGGQGGQGGSVSHSGNSSNVNVNDVDVKNSNKQKQNQSQGQEQGQSQSSRNTNKQNQNNDQSIAPNQVVKFSNETLAPASAPGVFAPALAVAPETCMGSTSGGGSGSNGLIGFGISFGTTWKSDSCELRMFARSLHSLGLNGAALALLAQDERVALALKDVGIKVPKAAEQPTAMLVQPTIKPTAQPLQESRVEEPTTVRPVEIEVSAP
jgi:hypothetical protein